MKAEFAEYYTPRDSDTDTVWRDAFIALDSSVLLGLYEYTPKTRDRLLEILSGLAPRLWLPHQVGLEFHRRRIAVKAEQFEDYASLRKIIIEEHLDKAIAAIDPNQKHPEIDFTQIAKILTRTRNQIAASLDRAKKAHPPIGNDDAVLEQVTALYEGTVGKPYADDKLSEIYKDGAKRFTRHQPPGYRDATKKATEADRFGDLVLWLQLLDHAKETQRPIIFVTADAKVDWWVRERGRSIMARPELIKEATALGVQYRQYRTEWFLERAEAFLALEAQPEAIREVRENNSRPTTTPAIGRRTRSWLDAIMDREKFINQISALRFPSGLDAMAQALDQLTVKSQIEDTIRAMDPTRQLPPELFAHRPYEQFIASTGGVVSFDGGDEDDEDTDPEEVVEGDETADGDDDTSRDGGIR